MIGEFAPALCLDTSIRAAPVQPGLSNDDRPVERLRADYVAVTRAPIWEHWWQSRYPASSSRRIGRTLALGGSRHEVVSVYAVEPRGIEPAQDGGPLSVVPLWLYRRGEFLNPEPFVGIVPDWLPAHRALVLISGFFEIWVGRGCSCRRRGGRRRGGWLRCTSPCSWLMSTWRSTMSRLRAGTSPRGRSGCGCRCKGVLIAWAWWLTQDDKKKDFPKGKA